MHTIILLVVISLYVNDESLDNFLSYKRHVFKLEEYSYSHYTQAHAKLDQISITPDARLIWVTFPGISSIGSFNLKTKNFSVIDVTAYRRKYPALVEYHWVPGTPPPDLDTISANIKPDGLDMYVSPEGSYRLWFGTQFSGLLASYDKGLIRFFQLPYDDAIPALVYVRDYLPGEEEVWISDHRNSRLIRFIPSKGVWDIFETISSDAWPTVTREENDSRLWIALYEADALMLIDLEHSEVYEYKLDTDLGPAFIQVDPQDNTVWITAWDGPYLLALHYNPDDPKSPPVLTKYRIASYGGIGPLENVNFRVFFVELRDENAIAVVIPEHRIYYKLKIPTPGSGLKDGAEIRVIVDDDTNEIKRIDFWFAEFDVDKLGHLTMTLPPPGQEDFDSPFNNSPIPSLLTSTSYSVASVSSSPYSLSTTSFVPSSPYYTTLHYYKVQLSQVSY